MFVSSTFDSRSNFTAQHLIAAEYFRDQVVSIELENIPSSEQFSPPQYIHYWFASVIFAAMAMDANAYDLMTTVNRNEESPAQGRLFRAEDLRKPLLERYNLLHQVAMKGKAMSLLIVEHNLFLT